MKLSIVTTLYRSASYIREFYERALNSIPKEFTEYEFIFVNDGSPDNSLEVALEMHQKDNKVTVIDLSRNFGHHKAIMTGLKHASGDYIFLIDVDLEEKPELLQLFWKEKINKEEIDVVYGVQITRKGKWFEKFSGSLFYKIFNLFSDTKIANNLVVARLMTRAYVNNLVAHSERELFLAGIFEITGYKQLPISVMKLNKGQTVYTTKRKIELLVNAISSFSNKPLLFIFYFGVLITILASLFVFYILFKKIFGDFQAGWASTIASIWFLGGVIIASIGVVGIYISKIFMEVKQRPYTIIKKIY